MHIVALRRDADGIHRITVHLHPADLGPVSVVAEIRGGAVYLQLAGATEAGREALRGALPDLRRELRDGGFTGCSLDLRQDAPHSGHAFRQEAAVRLTDRTDPPAEPAPTADPSTPPATEGHGSHRIDLHV